MDGKTLRDKLVGTDDERAVSPVIGVILMVAVTVILAATIAMMVTDIGGDTNPAPTADLDVADHDTSNDRFTIQHTSGDDLEASDLEIIAYDDTGASVDSITLDSVSASSGPSSTITAGDGFHVGYSTGSGSGDTVAEIRIVHSPSDTLVLSSSLSSSISDFDNWN